MSTTRATAALASESTEARGGLAAASKEVAHVLIEGHAFGSVSMTSYTLDAARA